MSTTNAPVGFRSVAAVTRGLDCPCCKDQRTKREIRRTARRVAKQHLLRDLPAWLGEWRGRRG